MPLPPDASRLRLQRAARPAVSTAGIWRVAGTDVYLLRQRGEWRMEAFDDNQDLWLAQHKLDVARFDRRRDALAALDLARQLERNV